MLAGVMETLPAVIASRDEAYRVSQTFKSDGRRMLTPTETRIDGFKALFKAFSIVQHNESKTKHSSTQQSQANEKSSIIFQKETKRNPTHQISNINKPIRIHLDPFPFGPVPQQPAHSLRDLHIAGESRASFCASAAAGHG